MNNLLENIYGILFEPVKTYKSVDISKPYKLPLLIVIIASFCLLILVDKPFTFWGLVAKSANMIIYWLFFAFFVNFLANIFNVKGNFSRLLSLLSFSFLPWIFLAPLKLLSNFSDYASTLTIILLFVIWIWTIALQILAISEVYNIPRKNAIALFFVPFLGCVLYFVWIVDFFVKLFQMSAF